MREHSHWLGFGLHSTTQSAYYEGRVIELRAMQKMFPTCLENILCSQSDMLSHRAHTEKAATPKFTLNIYAFVCISHDFGHDVQTHTHTHTTKNTAAAPHKEIVVWDMGANAKHAGRNLRKRK